MAKNVAGCLARERPASTFMDGGSNVSLCREQSRLIHGLSMGNITPQPILMLAGRSRAMEAIFDLLINETFALAACKSKSKRYF